MGAHNTLDSCTHRRLSEIIEAQARESEPVQRLSLIQGGRLEVLRQGESHVVPLTWGYSGGMRIMTGCRTSMSLVRSRL